MLCNNCKKTIPDSFQVCPYCNQPNNISNNALINYLKQNIAYLNSLKNYMETSLSNMEKTINSLSTLIEKQNIQPISSKPITLETKQTPKQLKETKTAKRDSVEEFFGEKLLLTVGIVIILFAAGFFLKYSFEKGMFSPLTRVLLTAGFGIVFILSGIKIREKQGLFGNIITSGGIAIIFFANFAGIAMYQLYGFLPAMLLNLILLGYSLKLADIFNSQWISIVGIGGAFLTPLFMQYPSNDYWYFFYIFLLAVSSIYFAYKKKWVAILLITCGFSVIWVSDWFYNNFTINIITGFIVLGFLLYLIFTIAPAFYLEKEDKNLSLLSSIGAMFFFPLFSISSTIDIPKTGVYLSILYFVSGFLMIFASKKIKSIANIRSISSYLFMLGVLTIFVGIYTNFSLICYTSLLALCVILSAYCYFMTDSKWLLKIFVILSTIIFFKLNLYDYANILGFDFNSYSFYTNENLPERLMEFFIVTVALIFASKIAYRKNNSLNAKILSLFAWLTIIIYSTFETSSFFNYHLEKAQSLSVSILWALIAFIALIYGVKAENQSARRSAFFLFSIVLFKVFLIDISGLETIYKVISFLIVGLILIISSYFYYSNTRKAKKGGN